MKELKQWLFCDILKEYLIQTDDIDKSNDEEIKKTSTSILEVSNFTFSSAFTSRQTSYTFFFKKNQF